jgi:hypothetical protein
MRFWGHVLNSLRNKNMKKHIPYLLLKMVFLAFMAFSSYGGLIGLRNNMHEYAAIFLKMSYRNDDVKFFFL